MRPQDASTDFSFLEIFEKPVDKTAMDCSTRSRSDRLATIAPVKKIWEEKQ